MSIRIQNCRFCFLDPPEPREQVTDYTSEASPASNQFNMNVMKLPKLNLGKDRSFTPGTIVTYTSIILLMYVCV